MQLVRFALVFFWSAFVVAQDIYPSISLTSDYRYNGVSYSNGEAAPQLSVHIIGPARTHAGVWASKVDFDDPGATSVEVDLYAGHTFALGKTDVSVELLYTFFPDKSFRSPTYDFLQGKARIARIGKRVDIGLQGAWTSEASYASGTALRFEVEGIFRFAAAWTASTHIGRRWIEVGRDRSYWHLGIKRDWRKFALDLKYVDTNLQSCSPSSDCDATIVGTITLKLW